MSKELPVLLATHEGLAPVWKKPPNLNPFVALDLSPVARPWASATPEQIIEDILKWKKDLEQGPAV